MGMEPLTSPKRVAVIMVLVGGVVGFMFAICSFAMIPFMAGILGYGFVVMWQYGELMGMYGMFGYPLFDLGIMSAIMFVWSLLMLTGASLSIYCGIRLRHEYWKKTAFFGIVGGIVLLLTFSWLPALLVLVGSILVYAS